MTTNRFATIELNSGYVWWVGHADSPEDACTQADEVSGLEPRHHVEISRATMLDGHGGYAVYIVPEALDIDDGQAGDVIRAVRVHNLVGYYRAI